METLSKTQNVLVEALEAEVTGTERPEAIKLLSLHNVIVALAVALACSAAAGSRVLRQSPTYRSSSALLFDQPAALALSGDPGTVFKLSALRQKYAALVTTSVVVRPVAARL